MLLFARLSLSFALSALCAGAYGQSQTVHPSAIGSGSLAQLQRLLDKQQQAISSGDPEAVISSSQVLTQAARQQFTRTEAAQKRPSSPAQKLKGEQHQLRQVLANGFNDWGTAEAKQQRYEDALHHFQEAEKWDASVPGLMQNLGTAAFRVGNYSESTRALDHVVAANPQEERVRLMLAMSEFSQDRFQDAAKNFSLASDVAMEDGRTAYAWAYSLVRTNQPRQANAIADILQTRSLPQDIQLLVCKLYTASESFELAVPCLKKLIQNSSTMPNAHYELGATLIRLDRPAEAIPELRAELAIDPKDIDAQYDLAYALLETSEKKESVNLLQSVLAINPSYTQAQYQLGKVLLEDGKIEPAIEHLEVATRLNPSDDFAHYQLQVAYRRAGRIEDANRELQKYKQLKAAKREDASHEVHESTHP
jgi:tetratricopeptide (TPR) repeat protein